MSDRPGTVAVRERHRFDESSLIFWLEHHLSGFRGPVVIRQFGAGQSNPTFHLAARTGEYVLRKKPAGTLLPSAHAIDREYRVLAALAGSSVPVPRVRLYCDDASIIGTPFYLMDYLPGRIFTDPLLPGMTPRKRRDIYEGMNIALAALHTFDFRAAGLADFGKPENYVERQLARWSGQYAASKTDNVPAMQSLHHWLEAHIPAKQYSTIAHGDLRIGNLIFCEAEPRVAAILDWELATLGHPFADLAYNCMSYHLPSGDEILKGFVGIDIAALGIPSEREYLEAYERRTGRDAATAFAFFMGFSLFRVAAIQQGVYARSIAGNATSDIAGRFGASYRQVARIGWELVCGL